MMTSTSSRLLFVIGHRNPDTDAICSAIGYAEYLRKIGVEEAVAARCGVINTRTEWVLKVAGVDAPRLLMDVRPTAAQICQRNVASARPSESFLDVYRKLTKGGYRSLPVLNEAGQVVAMPTLDDVLTLVVPGDGIERSMGDRRVHTSLARIVKVLNGEQVCGGNLETEEDLVLFVAASSIPTVERSLEQFENDRVLLLVGDRQDIQRVSIEAGVRALILTGDHYFDTDQIELARCNGVALVRCHQDTATAINLIRCSRPMSDAPLREFVSVNGDTLVEELGAMVRESPQPLFPVVDRTSNRLIGVFSKSDLIEPPIARLVLVDHNEFSQAVRGADDADIVEVIDHHRLSGNLVSREPVRFINEPVGSTSTIVGRAFRDKGLVPSRETAICLIAGMISDTLNLTSPTTTEVDREILPWLAEIADVEVNSFTRDFFEAGSVLREMKPEDAIGVDRKEYQEGPWRISISQIEELDLDVLEDTEEGLRIALEKMTGEGGFDFAGLLVTDITRHKSVLITAGKEKLVNAIDYPKLGAQMFFLDGVVSRKKQFFPYLSTLLSRISP